MNELSRIFKKIEGKKVLKQFIKNNLFFFVSFQILLLGFNRKALEIVKITSQFKIYNRLKKKYKYIKIKIDNDSIDLLPKLSSNVVWFCWLQGLENAPPIVKQCYESLMTNLPSKKIIIITAENVSEYVTFPNYILSKWKKGIITNTHFSDLLRLELLINHGGTWIDSTVYCTGNNIPKSMFESELFMFQMLKPGLDGHSISISSWFITSATNNKLLITTRTLLYDYWIKNNTLIDYFLFHIFFCIACDWYPCDWVKIPKYCNSIPHVLQLELFSDYDVNRYNDIKEMSAFHKLSNKFDETLKQDENTFYEVLFKRQNNLSR